MQKRIKKKETPIFPGTLYLKNYKLFNNLTNIKLKKINLFYGYNSSGKSSILESISLMKESIINPSEGTLATKGELQIPTFREIITDGNLEKNLSIGFRSKKAPIAIIKNFKWQNNRVNLISLTMHDVNFSDEEIPSDKNIIIRINFKKDEIAKFDNVMNVMGRVMRNMLVGKEGTIKGSGETLVGKIDFINHSSSFLKDLNKIFGDENFLRVLSFQLIDSLNKPNKSLLNKLYERFEIPKFYQNFDNNLILLQNEYFLSNNKEDFEKEVSFKDELTQFKIKMFKKSVFQSNISQENILYLINLIISSKEEKVVDFFIEEYKTNVTCIAEATLIYGMNLFGEAAPTGLDCINSWIRNYPEAIGEHNVTYERHLKEQLKNFMLPTNVLELEDQSANKNLINYIPISVERPKPEPIYIYSGSNPSDVGFDASNLPDLLYKDLKLVKNADKWLKKLGFNFGLDIKRLSNSDFFEIRFFDLSRNKGKKKISFSFKDIGTGLSSLIPIVINSVLLKSKILAIQEPERSLHPSYQIELMDLFCETLKTNKNEYLIETHSELLILRLMQLIKNKTISSEDVSINYISKDENGAKINNLKIDSDGNFVDEWPDGFFDERIKLSLL